MITRINSDNKQNYNVLFNKASVKLGLLPFEKEVQDENGEWVIKKFKYTADAGGNLQEMACTDADFDADGNFLLNGVISKGISSLNEYFQHIAQLAVFAAGVEDDGTSGTDPYFLRIPADEPFIEINANTRAISIPNELKQIGVVGDKYAEIVFFKIDRYFDAVDLATREIYIEWENAAGDKGYSRDYLKDTQSEKDKIIFGWIIDETLTKEIGNLRFAVRFIEVYDNTQEVNGNGTQLRYSFSSLPGQMTIANTLNYSLFDDENDLTKINVKEQASNIKWYLQNSDPDSENETAPELSGEPIICNGMDFPLGDVDLGEDKTLTLEIEAKSPDGGVISYSFARKASETSGSTGIPAQVKFKEYTVPELGNLADHIYYIKKENSIYAIATENELNNVSAGDILYYKVAYAIIDQPGYYYANIRNSVNGKKITTVRSNITHVPYAAMPEITEPLASYIILNSKDYEIVQNANIDNQLIYNEEHEPKLITNLTLNIENSNPSNTDGATLNVGVHLNDNGELQYQWFKKSALEDEWTLIGSGENIFVSQPGYYTAEISNDKNESRSIVERGSDAIGICHVVNMPDIPASAVKWDEFIEDAITYFMGDHRIKPYLVIDTHEIDSLGTLGYQWHIVTKDSLVDNDIPSDIQISRPNSAVYPLEIDSEGLAKIPFNPTNYGEGNYFIEITNTMYGKTAILLGADSREGNGPFGYIGVEADKGIDEEQ